MDSQITAAARALAAGAALEALKRVALRDDPPALALRGIAMAQLGELVRARELLRTAARRFGTREPVARARCIAAEAEIALATRDLGGSPAPLAAARRTLEARGDHTNALHARCVEIRRLILLGRVTAAERALAELDLRAAPPTLVAVGQLLHADVALRTMRTRAARAALAEATSAASRTGFPALMAEIAVARAGLDLPAARRIAGGEDRLLVLEEVEALYASNVLVADACRRVVRDGRDTVSLTRRPVLFALARALAEAWPSDASRELLIARAFAATRPNASHRARLRVEIGRLRKTLAPVAEIRATEQGFALAPRESREAVVLALPEENIHADVLALLSDGESWSSSALALALGDNQRNVQRALDELASEGKANSFGRGRALRWMAPPLPGFTTPLLLPGLLPGV